MQGVGVHRGAAAYKFHNSRKLLHKLHLLVGARALTCASPLPMMGVMETKGSMVSPSLLLFLCWPPIPLGRPLRSALLLLLLNLAMARLRLLEDTDDG